MESLEAQVYLFIAERYYPKDSELHPPLEEKLWLENGGYSDDPPERTLYWESQAALLQEILERYQSTGSKLRHDVGQIIEMVKPSDYCSCFKPSYSNCPNCLRRRVVAVLCDRGFNAKLCISKWGTTKKFPGGSHEYIEVIASTLTRKKQIPFLIELEFRDQFQIAKAGEEYQKLLSCLPEVYIGKLEYLTAIVGVMCDAAKKSMKEKKMHMGPWRKSSFMKMKWSGFNQTWTSDKPFGSLQASESYLRISGVVLLQSPELVFK